MSTISVDLSKMKYNELSTKLISLLKTNISQTELADILGYKRQVINNRAARNSSFSKEEIEKIENYYHLDLFAKSTNNNQIVITGNIMRIKVPKGTTLVVEYED